MKLNLIFLSILISLLLINAKENEIKFTFISSDSQGNAYPENLLKLKLTQIFAQAPAQTSAQIPAETPAQEQQSGAAKFFSGIGNAIKKSWSTVQQETGIQITKAPEVPSDEIVVVALGDIKQKNLDESYGTIFPNKECDIIFNEQTHQEIMICKPKAYQKQMEFKKMTRPSSILGFAQRDYGITGACYKKLGERCLCFANINQKNSVQELSENLEEILIREVMDPKINGHEAYKCVDPFVYLVGNWNLQKTEISQQELTKLQKKQDNHVITIKLAHNDKQHTEIFQNSFEQFASSYLNQILEKPNNFRADFGQFQLSFLGNKEMYKGDLTNTYSSNQLTVKNLGWNNRLACISLKHKEEERNFKDCGLQTFEYTSLQDLQVGQFRPIKLQLTVQKQRPFSHSLLDNTHLLLEQQQAQAIANEVSQGRKRFHLKKKKMMKKAKKSKKIQKKLHKKRNQKKQHKKAL